MNSETKRFISRLEPIAKEAGYTIEIAPPRTQFLWENLALRPKDKNKATMRFDDKSMNLNFALAEKELKKLK